MVTDIMYNVGDIVKLNDWGMAKLYWWQHRFDEFRIKEFGRINPKEFSCVSLHSDWHAVLTTDYVELVESLPVNIEDFL